MPDATDRNRVRDLFAALRKQKIGGQKIRARMAFLCCGSCAAYEFATTTPHGTPSLYFTRQDDEAFDDTGNFKRTVEIDGGRKFVVSETLYIGYGVNERSENIDRVTDTNLEKAADEREARQLELARLIVETAQQHGFDTTWDHTTAGRIGVSNGERQLDAEMYRLYSPDGTDLGADDNSKVLWATDQADADRRAADFSRWWLKGQTIIAVRWDKKFEAAPTWVNLATP